MLGPFFLCSFLLAVDLLFILSLVPTRSFAYCDCVLFPFSFSLSSFSPSRLHSALFACILAFALSCLRCASEAHPPPAQAASLPLPEPSARLSPRTMSSLLATALRARAAVRLAAAPRRALHQHSPSQRMPTAAPPLYPRAQPAHPYRPLAAAPWLAGVTALAWLTQRHCAEPEAAKRPRSQLDRDFEALVRYRAP